MMTYDKSEGGGGHWRGLRTFADLRYFLARTHGYESSVIALQTVFFLHFFLAFSKGQRMKSEVHKRPNIYTPSSKID